MTNANSPKLMQHSRLRRIVRESAGFILLLLGLLAVRSTLADHYYVPSGSMEPTLMPGDRVVVDKVSYGLRVPFTSLQVVEGDSVLRGEVVIFDSPRDGTRLIKRIVAVGGDEVVVRNGRLIINGEAMSHVDRTNTEMFGERMVSLNMAAGGGPDFFGAVPQGKLLAMGDHRGNSLDGRVFGVIDEVSVYGRAIAVYFRSGDGFTWKKL
jgi:signal peptidase I